jgi:hypothetical protein
LRKKRKSYVARLETLPQGPKQAAEKGIVLKGNDFSRADKGNKINGL